ncbi:hypothetical protein KUH03_03765 [Sphingobacterium sp. E70]|uniref:hypothetical protein n=1 Tax=Sphingobacterium sp. E70 TaxID=2853439 RepID=UPI00211BEFE8|nr:hypothetical protein [Sphingobacterium sp. E70]ULT26086.1 hypothetical protein KUH03_03765 [Sphingobacterium sp. E70]
MESEDAGVKNEQDLRDELFQANLKIIALEMLIKKAEELHGADFVKSLGPNRPGNEVVLPECFGLQTLWTIWQNKAILL